MYIIKSAKYHLVLVGLTISVSSVSTEDRAANLTKYVIFEQREVMRLEHL